MAQTTLLTTANLVAPVNAAFVQSDTGGSLVASTLYYYRIVAVNNAGKTQGSTETSQTTSAAAPATHSMAVNWNASVGATSYEVYGRTTGAEQLIAVVGNVLTYTDTGAITPSGALPGSNTASALGAGPSADITVTAAAPATVGLFAANAAVLPSYPAATIQRKDPNGAYVDTGIALSRSNPNVLLNAPGTYRAFRNDMTQTATNPAQTLVGVMQDT